MREKGSSSMKIEIKHKHKHKLSPANGVLFSHVADENSIRITVEAAVRAGANLAYADLDGANLAGANLADADLAGADLDGASLDGANLADADLAGAKLKGGETLIGERPVFQVGPIGSRCALLTAYITDAGLRFDAGCKRQISRDEFDELLAETHGDNEHAMEYRAALAMIDAHAEIWTPKGGA